MTCTTSSASLRLGWSGSTNNNENLMQIYDYNLFLLRLVSIMSTSMSMSNSTPTSTSTLEDIYDLVDFARRSLFSDEHIDDYTNQKYITKLLQFLHIDAWLVARSNMLLSQDANEESLSFVAFCFGGTSALYIDTSSKQVTYFNFSTSYTESTSQSTPKLVERFVNRTYPNHHLHHFVLKSIGDKHRYNVPPWIMTTWFITVLSKCKNEAFDNHQQLCDLLQKEYEDVSFIASFHDMCWEVVSATRIKNVHLTYTVNRASVFAVLDILHQQIKCYCRTMIEDARYRKQHCHLDADLAKCIEMSKAITYSNLLACWDRLQKWSSLHKGDMTYMKNAHIEMCHLVLDHYRYLKKSVNVNYLVDDSNKKINTIMDLRDNVDDLITRTLCPC